ncbi:response regulator transcription factor [Glycomyces sp. NPDC046736]|uniref:response regulator transcription factor n=1 Tax=Glycomyces sp. NPDC046736 TaxID=3155615 RepID=UPI0033F5ECD5
MSAEALSPNGIRLLIVDDHPIVRDGLRSVFGHGDGIEVVGDAPDGRAAVERATALEPDVVLMDLRMPGGDGVTAIRELAARGSAAKVLVLTTYDTDADVLPAIEAGASGYLLKDASPEELRRAIRTAHEGGTVLAPAVASLLMDRVRKPAAAPGPLSDRELEVLALVAKGRGNREAAKELFISEATIKTHLLHVYAKLGVNDRAAAVAAAYERGLLSPKGR